MWPWILLGILAAIIIIIIAALCLPVDLMLKNDQQNNIIFRVKFFFKTYGEKSDKKKEKTSKKKKPKKKAEGENSFVKALKEATGISRYEKQNLKATIKEDGIGETVAKTVSVVTDLLKEVAGTLKHTKAKRFTVRIVCAEDDAADTAINYGRCCSVVYPIVGYLGCYMKIPKRVRNIDISCDYSGKNGAFFYDFIIRIKVGFLLIAALKILAKQAFRTLEEKRAKEALKPPQSKQPQNRATKNKG